MYIYIYIYNFLYIYRIDCILQQWCSFGKNQKWLLMTSPQGQKLRAFVFLIKRTCVRREACLEVSLNCLAFGSIMIPTRLLLAE